MSKTYYAWDQIDAIVGNLAEDLKGIHIDYICPIQRGGLIPGTMLSHLLDVPVNKVIRWSTRDQNIQEVDPQIVHDLTWSNKVILLVDDINDSGSTFSGLLQGYGYNNTGLGKIITVSLLQRSTSSFISDYNGEVINNDDWVVFPWEQQ